MSRIAMSCYAAAKHPCTDNDNKIARVVSKDKPKERKYEKDGAISVISLDKYNGKLMNSIWGLYNRNSPHNLKSLNQEVKRGPFEQGNAYIKASFVQFAIPNFGVAEFEAKIEVIKPKITLEKLENIFNSPPFQ